MNTCETVDKDDDGGDCVHGGVVDRSSYSLLSVTVVLVFRFLGY